MSPRERLTESMLGHQTNLNQAQEEQVRAAARILREGGVVAIPTDTLYGLAACAFDTRAVNRVLDLKARPQGMPLPLLLGDVEDIGRYAACVPDKAWDIVERFMPGALTVILRKAPDIPDNISAGSDTVALRVPDHPVPRAVVRLLGAPITGTSANRSGQPASTTADAVRAIFGDELDLVIDALVPLSGRASTLVDLSAGAPRIIRRGDISLAQLVG